MEKIPFTPAGLEKLKEELYTLKNTERQAIIKAIAEARGMVICLKMQNITPQESASPLSKAE